MEPYRSTDATAGPYGMYILAVVLLVGGLLVYLWGHVNTMAQGQEMNRLRVERKALIQQQSHLKARLAGLKHSSRIREIAVQKLGMGFPEGPPRNLYLEPQPGTKGVN